MSPARSSEKRLLLVLMATVIVQQIDRNIINVLLEPLKSEFHLSDAQLGLLAGTLFAASYMVAGVPLGRLADRVNRRNLLAILLTTWSGLTALSALSQSLLVLMLARMGVGAAESGSQPTSLSMMSDIIPAQRRATIGGMLYGAAMFGGFLSYVIGGFAAAEWGWRSAFLVAALPGFLLALYIFLSIEEPVRAAPVRSAATGRAALMGDLRELLFHPVLGPLYLAATMCTLVASAISAWAVSLLIRVHGVPLQEAGLAVAVASGLCGAAGTPLAGWLSDRAGRLRPGHALRIPAVTAAICGLAGLAFANSNSVPAAIAALCLVGLTSQAHTGAVIGTISRTAPPQVRALAFSLFSVVGSVLGLAIGPWLVGALSDGSTADQPLSRAISMVVPIVLAPMTLFLLAARRLDNGPAVASAN